ncbi:MAG: PhzF family phenazine biosynthesis protein [Burkholderiales bacterium]|nr:PhzF family phenazine biosynthesis protein [Burkholderiales bacterium]
MKSFAFRIVNVFAESPLAGNPLCVFEDGSDLDDATMQALALQFNLSETTFVLPSAVATARVRIFTPTFEMPFAGHPTLGTAHVVRALNEALDQERTPKRVSAEGSTVTLEMKAGVIPVTAAQNVWTLSANAPKHRAPDASNAELAAMLGLAPSDLLAPPLWVDTGSEQLVIPAASFDAVRRAAPKAELLAQHASNGPRTLAYVFAREGDRVLARFFFGKHGAVVEDPGTGSACANLGGWLIATAATLPQHLAVDQGEAVGRPCRLGLEVTAGRQIKVSGRVIEIGRGTIAL